MNIAGHRLLVAVFSLAACFMTTGCFSCSLSTSESTPALTKSVRAETANTAISYYLDYRMR